MTTIEDEKRGKCAYNTGGAYGCILNGMPMVSIPEWCNLPTGHIPPHKCKYGDEIFKHIPEPLQAWINESNQEAQMRQEKG